MQMESTTVQDLKVTSSCVCWTYQWKWRPKWISISG